ncbi:MAG: hypothetical protein RAO92_03625 [Candidatus Euphemobacter frigidus]|nr:hypothetical protein [Candidatus Euphemobacter frigidus]MDP8275472.1 hypothetical protein [Candidatus Euphemobacter frigidus]
MRTLIATLSIFILISCPALFGGETIQEITWREYKSRGGAGEGEVIRPEGEAGPYVLELKNREDRRKTARILIIKEPALTMADYAINGQVKYQGVEGDGYLEMWSVFADGSRYFSRTLGTGGPMEKLHGSSGWRDFVLPFRNKPGNPPPEKLIVNVVLPGPGTVWVGPLRLVELKPGEDPLALPGQWWTGRSAGLFGAIAGSLLGLTGGLIGILAGRGRARRLVLNLLTLIRIAGICALLAGIIAIIRSQPYAVFYPLLLLGVIAAGVSFGVRPAVRRRYVELELRRMRARDSSY